MTRCFALQIFYFSVVPIAPFAISAAEMVRNYKKKERGGRANLKNHRSIEEAVAAVQRDEMGLNQAARYFGISKGSLHRRVSGQVPIHASVGRGTVFNPLEEAEIAECIKLFAEWG